MDNKVIKELKSDKSKAKACNDIKELVKICNCLGRKYLQTQRYSEAIDEHNDELHYSLQLRCQLSEAVARRALGECYSEINEYTKALTEHKKYLSLARSLGDQIETQRAFATIGRTHLLRAQELYNNNNEINKKVLFEAKYSFSKALQLCEDLTEELKDKELAEMRSRLYLNLGLVSEILGQFKEAMTSLHLSIALNKQFHLTEDLFRSQFCLASVYEKNKDLQMASNGFVEALKTAKILKNKIHTYDALIGNGMTLMRSLMFQESRKQFKKAYYLNSPIPEDRQKAERLLKISSFICDDFNRLLKTNDLEEKISSCDKLGDHFVELKMFDISIDFYKKELNYSVQSNKTEAEIAPIYVSIAQTYADDLNFKAAIENFRHELNCNRGNGLEEAKSLLKIAEMTEYLKSEELDQQIIETYEEALEKIANLDNSLLIDILHRYLAFIQSRRLMSDKVPELKEKIKILSLQKTTEIEMAEEDDEPDIYDTYNLNDLSDCSTHSDEEVPKRMRKSNIINQKGETSLHKACIAGKLKQVERILVDKHRVNERDHCGWTPLHEAANFGHLNVVKFLLETGANINDNEGIKTDAITPLHDACSNGHFDVIRFLLKSGAKVDLLNKFNETALETLRDWKKREYEELTDSQLQDFKLTEKQLEDCLKKAGFVRENIPILDSSDRKPRAHMPVLRGRDSISEDSDDMLDIPINRVQYNRLNYSNVKHKRDKCLDFDDPKVARREYSSSISNLRRNDFKDRREKSREVRPKPKSIPALLNEKDVIDDDQWLINDFNDTRKRTCLDAYDALNKKAKTSDSNCYRKPRRPKQSFEQMRTQSESYEQTEAMSSDNESDSGIQVCEPIVDRRERIKEIRDSNEISQTITSTNFKSITLRVSVGDSENTSLIIPILNKSSNFLWLNKEVEKRYFEKFGVKPVISLETTDGALLSDEDSILDVVNGNELKVMAKIVSWIMDPLDERYKEICNICRVQPLTDIIKELQITQINGCLKLCDVNVPIDQIKPIFRAIQRQNNLREIDISCSNVIFEDTTDFLNCLPLLPSLQVLNLKCTALGLQTMEQLATKSCLNLVDLNLSFNSFGNYFSEAIVKLIKHFRKLNVIDLSACDLTDCLLGSNEFNDGIKNSSLRSVILDHNRIDSELIQRFSKL